MAYGLWPNGLMPNASLLQLPLTTHRLPRLRSFGNDGCQVWQLQGGPLCQIRGYNMVDHIVQLCWTWRGIALAGLVPTEDVGRQQDGYLYSWHSGCCSRGRGNFEAPRGLVGVVHIVTLCSRAHMLRRKSPVAVPE